MNTKNQMDLFFQDFFEKLEAPGIFQYGVIPTRELEFAREVRKLCEDNVCGRYSKSWTCPPAIGTLEECRAKCLSYSHMAVFNQVFPLEDSFDYPGMLDAMKRFGDMCGKVNLLAKQHFDDFFLLANEGCGKCGTCTYPDAPCRFPDDLHPALEGMGLYVYKLAEQAGMNYINGKNTVTYFGGLLFHDHETAVREKKDSPSF